MSSNYKFKSDTIENDYGVFSIEETMQQLNDKRRIISRINSSSFSGRRNSISSSSSSNSSSNGNISEVVPAIKSVSHHFRMIVCGDSGNYV